MSEPIISKKTLYEFKEYLSRCSVLREIEAYFDSADITYAADFDPETSGERRIVTSRYYHSLNLCDLSDVKKLLRAFEDILFSLEKCIQEAESGGFTRCGLDDYRKSFEILKLRLKQDGFTYQDGRIITVGQVPSLAHLESIAVTADFPYLIRQLDRIETSIDTDPWLAIGTAKELVETTCKTILLELGRTVDKDWDLMELCKEARKVLKLTPDDIPNTVRAADTVKRLLNNLATVVQGLAELRNPYGTGHGHDGRARGLQPRHARLAAGAASTLALFLLETHRDSQERTANSGD